MKIVKAEELEIEEALKYFDDVVAIPTETVYGLAANIYNADAVKKIFVLKGRPMDNPLIVHVSSLRMLETIIEEPISDGYRKLIDRFWPGPLTLVFEASSAVSSVVTGGLSTVAVRMPKNRCVLGIIEALGAPLAAPSANISGGPSPTTAGHVRDDFGDRLGLIIDGGPCSVGLESTVVSFRDGRLLVLRPGSITARELEETLGCSAMVRSRAQDGEVLSPGQRYRHYAPSSPLILIKGSLGQVEAELRRCIEKLDGWERPGVMVHSGMRIDGSRVHRVFDMGDTKGTICSRIFKGLRELDGECNLILAAGIDEGDEGLAIMDRLEKAATDIIKADNASDRLSDY
jgi:L-threonylcarbamoyladenylate synthase